jgi:hypothetical protein
MIAVGHFHFHVNDGGEGGVTGFFYDILTPPHIRLKAIHAYMSTLHACGIDLDEVGYVVDVGSSTQTLAAYRPCTFQADAAGRHGDLVSQ